MPDQPTPATSFWGSIVAEYAIEEPLGGTVFRARHGTSHQVVALKLLPSPFDRQPDATGWFFRETRALSGVRSEHLAAVIDVGTSPDGRPFLVREFLEGATIDAVVAAEGPLPIDEACSLALQALEGLSHAHAAGLVHRNLKPSNLIVSAAGAAPRGLEICDFGLPDPLERSREQASPEAQAALAWAAPEQRAGGAPDPRADLWSVAALLHLMLTGRAPQGLPSGATSPLREWRKDVPAALEAVCDRALQADPAKRFSSATALAQSLAPFARRDKDLEETFARAPVAPTPRAASAPSAPVPRKVSRPSRPDAEETLPPPSPSPPRRASKPQAALEGEDTLPPDAPAPAPRRASKPSAPEAEDTLPDPIPPAPGPNEPSLNTLKMLALVKPKAPKRVLVGLAVALALALAYLLARPAPAPPDPPRPPIAELPPAPTAAPAGSPGTPVETKAPEPAKPAVGPAIVPSVEPTAPARPSAPRPAQRPKAPDDLFIDRN